MNQIKIIKRAERQFEILKSNAPGSKAEVTINGRATPEQSVAKWIDEWREQKNRDARRAAELFRRAATGANDCRNC